LARLREGCEEFTSRDVVVIAVGPNSPIAFEQYWENEKIPFIGVPDPQHNVAKKYKQEVNLFKLGRMPLNCVIDANGYIRFANYGKSMADIPDNEELLSVIDELNAASE